MNNYYDEKEIKNEQIHMSYENENEKKEYQIQPIKILKILKGYKQRDTSIIALVNLKNEKVIMKLEKYPGWRIFWEYRVASILKNHLSSILQLSKPISLAKLKVCVDEKDCVLFPVPEENSSSNYLTRTVDVLLSEYVEGISFASMIRQNSSLRLLFSGIYQVLACLASAHHIIHVTHYDLHANNIIAEILPSSSYVFLFDISNEPLMVFSEGVLMKIIDYEYSYVEGMEGVAFDAKLDLCRKGYNPALFDPGYDCLRFLISTLTFYSSLYENNWTYQIRDTLCSFFNENFKGSINENGILSEINDTLRKRILNHEDFQTLPLFKRLFLERYYYIIIGLLSHTMTYPIKEKIHKPNIEPIITFFRIFLEPNIKNPERLLRILMKLIKSRNIEKTEKLCYKLKITTYHINNIRLWLATLLKSIEDCLDHLETKLFKYITKILKKRRNYQNAENFSPIKMFKWLYNHYPQTTIITKNFTVIWMQNNDIKKIKLDNVHNQELDDINLTQNLIEKSQKLKNLLLKTYLYL